MLKCFCHFGTGNHLIFPYSTLEELKKTLFHWLILFKLIMNTIYKPIKRSSTLQSFFVLILLPFPQTCLRVGAVTACPDKQRTGSETVVWGHLSWIIFNSLQNLSGMFPPLLPKRKKLHGLRLLQSGLPLKRLIALWDFLYLLCLC